MIDLPQWLLLMAVLLAAAVLLGVVARRMNVPVTVAFVVAGFAVNWLGEPFGFRSPLREAHGEDFEEVVVFLLLPALVFAAALGLNTRAFFRNLGAILMLAVVALIVSAVLVGIALNAVLGTPFAAALLFGALISATDPVAVVAVFREVGVPRRLLTLVEGESLLNDGVAIVMFEILVVAATGGAVLPQEGMIDFVRVFVGGAALGSLVGLAVAFVVPWLRRLPAAALSIAAAYGGFVLAQDIFGFSGVMATVAAGVVMGGLAPTRASEAVRAIWTELWEALDYVANALLFLLVGLAIDAELITSNLGAIALAIVVVLAARALAVLPLIRVLERFARIPRVGRRNSVVLVWGGLRGGVALALALALPSELPQRDVFVAMTGGVVLATLVINATTIKRLVHRLRLDQPSRADRFLALGARLAGLAAARTRLAELGLDDPLVARRLEDAQRAVHMDLEQIELTSEEELDVVVRRGLFVERESYQRLSDAGLLPATTTRALLGEVDDHIEEVGLGRPAWRRTEHRDPARLERVWQWILGWLPKPLGEDPGDLAYAEMTGRRIAARRATEELDLFDRFPNVSRETVEQARATFARWEQEAVDAIRELDEAAASDQEDLHRRQADALSRVSSEDALESLVRSGLLPRSVAERATEAIAATLNQGPDRARV